MITPQATQKFALLRMPEWFGVPEIEPLPAPPEAYRIVEAHPGWFEVRGPGGALVYSGLGPVQILANHHV
ncbi:MULTISPECIES: hypothetical protein [Delftia]|uniref:Uncharacterized protein n=1 Tax=Delftia lacustris TaxID=558537 RepID=A0A7T2YTK4_9BURK|nr:MULTISPECIES: hypothetical protein [Delftia]EPD40137.1 hypothetical protein HMPREF9702_03993 [Delftia acidovorans CCUG 15835]MDC2861049.1 hypothetical protein [Delftia sp. DT-2]QPS81702.1 hypothetical protein I6G47_01050 [Delftia lacustris]SFB21745.1 hypothetical protein SAMN05444579_10369 [Delftia tsuruhatensis]